MTELKAVLASIKNDDVLNKYVKQDRAEYNSRQNTVKVYLKTQEHLFPCKYIRVEQKLVQHETPSIQLKLLQTDFRREIINSSKMLEKCIKDFLILKQPAIKPFVCTADIKLKESHLEILFSDNVGADLFACMKLDKLSETFLREMYQIDAVATTNVDAAACSEYEFSGQFSSRQNLKVVKQQPKDPIAQRPRKTNVPEKRPSIRKMPVKPSNNAVLTPISNLAIGNKYTVKGEVLSVEAIPLRNGELTKHVFDICDYTGSLSCFFIESSKYKCKISPPKKGAWIQVDGTYDTDNYARDNTMKVRKIEKSNHKTRTDTASQKRVELHAHTQMSAQDAVSSVGDMVKRAADWGHKAIAITDHGVVQAFPEAENAGKQNNIKIIYGLEAYMIDDTKKLFAYADDASFDSEFVIFDIETTGLNPATCDITEIGAVRFVNGKRVDEFQSFVRPSKPIPPKIITLTGITDEMVKDAPMPEEVLEDFRTFCGDSATLVAHNAPFDTKFVFGKSKEFDIYFPNKILDNIAVCKLAYPDLKNYKLDTIAAHLGIQLDHHRAVNDAVCTAEILFKAFDVFREKNAQSLHDINDISEGSIDYKQKWMRHVILLCKNKKGLTNLYRLVSESHLNYFHRRPRIPKSLIQKYRDGLLVGSACENSDVYAAIVDGASTNTLKDLASFYDYLEIQPLGNNEFMVEKGILADMNAIENCNKKMVELGEQLNKPVVATCDVHFLEPHGEYFRRILQKQQGFKDSKQPPLYLRTTEEMLDEFSYLGNEKAYEVVVENTNKIADQTEEIDLFGNETAMPHIEDADVYIEELAYSTAKEKYGDPLPEIVEERLKRELDSIIGHGFAVLYYSAHKLVQKSMEDGYLVGSRGSVGSSFAATMTGITEVNPLPPHYICPSCKHSDFSVDRQAYECGVDLPDAVCPNCDNPYLKDGFDIPFEVFLGINADKVPDIDLNFSGEYQPTAHKYTEEMFGKEHVFRAGTISAIQDRTAYGYVRNYLDETGTHANEAEINRLKLGISGVKRTTGQHPGGMVIVPQDREIYEFTPVQRPADNVEAEFVTTHFDFNSMEDILIKLDILGHDVPTIIRQLQDLTGIDPLQIPLDDEQTMELFSSIEPLGIQSNQLFDIKTGTLGVPEFGTRFVRQMLLDTKPSTMGEIVRISGLSHGTDVWLGNAQDLIKNGVCVLKEAICTRDDIMNYLVARGVEKRTAFFIMENVRKGAVARNGFTDEQTVALKDAQIPQWFIESCEKIKYMFPKAHAAAYVIMAYRIAYCKVHYKEAFYASYFTVRSGEFDGSLVLDGVDDIKKHWQNIESKGNTATANEKNMAAMLEVACEMYLRGIHFLPVDLYKSDAVEYIIEDGNLRLPFQSVPQLGENAARSIIEARNQASFLSVEDLRERTRVSNTVVEEMQKMGTLTGLKQENQMSLFDI